MNLRALAVLVLGLSGPIVYYSNGELSVAALVPTALLSLAFWGFVLGFRIRGSQLIERSQDDQRPAVQVAERLAAGTGKRADGVANNLERAAVILNMKERGDWTPNQFEKVASLGIALHPFGSELPAPRPAFEHYVRSHIDNNRHQLQADSPAKMLGWARMMLASYVREARKDQRDLGHGAFYLMHLTNDFFDGDEEAAWRYILS